MATELHNLSVYNAEDLPNADALRRQRFGIVVADWNSHITHAMMRGAIETLLRHGVQAQNISVTHVPGTVELTYGAWNMLTSNPLSPFHAIIVIGCVIQGDTPHFDYVCQSVTQGVTLLNAQGGITGGIQRTHTPVIFSVLTTLNEQQALDRAGGRLGNKGVEGAQTAMRMANLKMQNLE